MNLTNLTPEDPKLTAYALGELDADESARVATLIQNDPAAQAAIQEIRSLAGQLEEALEHEPILAELPREETSAPFAPPSSGKLHRFPYYWVTGLAAACFLLVLTSRQQPTVSDQPKGAAEVAQIPSVTAKNPTTAPAASNDPLPVVETRKRTLPVQSDVRPAPLREDRMRLGSTVADNSDSRDVRFSAESVGESEDALSAGAASAARAMASTDGVGRNGSSTTIGRPHELSIDTLGASGARGSVALQPSSSGLARRSRDYSPSLNYGNQLPDPSSTLNRKREAYAYQPAQGFLGVAGYPLSSFSATVETASYASVRSSLENGQLPSPDAVRVEEMLNYFSYGYNGPRDGNALAASLEVAAAPWNPAHRLVRIGLKGRDLPAYDGDAITVAKDVRLEVEFNPEQARSYRLIGYENRTPIKSEGPVKLPGSEVDAGHALTALYEVVPIGAPESSSIDGAPLRYDAADAKRLAMDDPRHRELLTLKIRYKLPTVDVSRKMELPLVDTGTDFALASKDFKFAAAVAGFGMLLKESPHKGSATYDKIVSWAEEGQDNQDDPAGHRHEFIDLVKKAKDATKATVE